MNVSVIYANITKLLLYYFQISYLFSDILLTLKDEHENVASNRIREIAKGKFFTTFSWDHCLTITFEDLFVIEIAFVWFNDIFTWVES